SNSNTSPTIGVYLPLLVRTRIGAPGRSAVVCSRMLNIACWTESVLVISRQTAWMVPRIVTLYTADVVGACVSAIGFPLGFDPVLDFGQPLRPELAVLGRPAVVDDLDRHDVEIQSPLAAVLLGVNQSGRLQHGQVL